MPFTEHKLFLLSSHTDYKSTWNQNIFCMHLYPEFMTISSHADVSECRNPDSANVLLFRVAFFPYEWITDWIASTVTTYPTVLHSQVTEMRILISLRLYSSDWEICKCIFNAWIFFQLCIMHIYLETAIVYICFQI